METEIEDFPPTEACWGPFPAAIPSWTGRRPCAAVVKDRRSVSAVYGGTCGCIVMIAETSTESQAGFENSIETKKSEPSHRPYPTIHGL
jgi:hypothetical protein